MRFFQSAVLLLIAVLLYLSLCEWIMSQLFVSDEANGGGEKEMKGEIKKKKTPSRCAVGGTVAPGSVCRLVKDN